MPNSSRAVIAGSTSGRMSPSPLGLLDQVGHDLVELRGAGPAPRRSVPVLPRARSSSVTYGKRSASTPTLPRTRRSSRSIAGSSLASDLVGDREQAVERPVQRQREQVFLAVHVVVDRGLGDAEPPRQVLHAGAVVAALVEDGRRPPPAATPGRSRDARAAAAWPPGLAAPGGPPARRLAMRHAEHDNIPNDRSVKRRKTEELTMTVLRSYVGRDTGSRRTARAGRCSTR